MINSHVGILNYSNNPINGKVNMGYNLGTALGAQLYDKIGFEFLLNFRYEHIKITNTPYNYTVNTKSIFVPSIGLMYHFKNIQSKIIVGASFMNNNYKRSYSSEINNYNNPILHNGHKDIWNMEHRYTAYYLTLSKRIRSFQLKRLILPIEVYLKMEYFPINYYNRYLNLYTANVGLRMSFSKK